MEEFDTLDSSEKTIYILGDRWWPQVVKQEEDKLIQTLLCTKWNQPNKRPNVGGLDIRSRNGAPSR